jgi:hypothetical protein
MRGALVTLDWFFFVVLMGGENADTKMPMGLTGQGWAIAPKLEEFRNSGDRDIV